VAGPHVAAKLVLATAKSMASAQSVIAIKLLMSAANFTKHNPMQSVSIGNWIVKHGYF
jgi:hypothetical protein